MKNSLPASFLQLFKKTKSRALAGISVLSDKVQLVKLSPSQDGFKCDICKEVDLASEEQLPAVLTRLINEFDLTSCSTSIVIPANRVQSTQIESAELPEGDIQAALPWKVKELINIAPQDMVCDYIDMPLQPTGQGAKTQVLATSKKYLEAITLPFHESGAEIAALTTEQFAYAKLQTTQDAAQLIFIQNKKADAVLLIVKNQEICFARKIRNSAVIMEMTPEQLEMGGSDSIAIEIQRSIDYFESQLKQPPIKNALLSMQGENAERLVSALNQVLPVRTKLISIENIEDGEQLDISFMSALGAALYTQPHKVESEEESKDSDSTQEKQQEPAAKSLEGANEN